MLHVKNMLHVKYTLHVKNMLHFSQKINGIPQQKKFTKCEIKCKKYITYKL